MLLEEEEREGKNSRTKKKQKINFKKISQQQCSLWFVTLGKAAVTVYFVDTTWPTIHPCFSIYPLSLWVSVICSTKICPFLPAVWKHLCISLLKLFDGRQESSYGWTLPAASLPVLCLELNVKICMRAAYRLSANCIHFVGKLKVHELNFAADASSSFQPLHDSFEVSIQVLNPKPI